jgi:hypothetical protein
MIGLSREVVTYSLALASGAVLFFLSFAAVFNGIWPLLILFVLCYAGAGALGVRIGGAAPGLIAIVLVLPAFPWVMWLFPASIPEAGILRALLWPSLMLVMATVAWLGGRLAGTSPVRPGQGTPAA